MQPQLRQKPEINKDLIFCYTEHKPQTLVMLYPPQRVIEKMLKPADQIYVLWIIDSLKSGWRAKASLIQKETGAKIVTLASLAELKNFLVKNQQISKNNVVCSPQMLEGIKFIKRKISSIILYPITQEEVEQKQQDKKGLFIFYAMNEEELFQLINSRCVTKPKYKELMNFVALNSDVGKSNTLIRTLLAMINQPIDQNTREQIVNQFKKIAYRASEKCLIQHFMDQLSKGLPDTKSILKWYTGQTEIYKIINNLLRACSHPAQIFYLQPIFKDLFTAIQSLEKKSENKQFVCYRGGFIEKIELEEIERNIGRVVKNLSFLSTSLNEHTAQRFQTNVLFQISVPISEEGSSQFTFGYGYAQIKKMSYFAGEEEVLFNPLCSFTVLQIKESGKNQYKVKLKYEKWTNKRKKSESTQFHQKNKLFRYFGKLHKKWETQVTNQGIPLQLERQHLQNSFDYWEKYVQIAYTSKDKIQGLFKLINTKSNRGNPKYQVEESKRLFKKEYGNVQLEQVIAKRKKNHSQETKLYLRIIATQIQVQHWQGQYRIAQKTCQKIINSLEKEDPLYSVFLHFSSRFNDRFGRYKKSVQLMQMSLQLSGYHNEYGEYNIDNIRKVGSLVYSYIYMGKYESALKLCQKFLMLSQILLGETHNTHLHFKYTLAIIFKQHGKEKESQEIRQQCLRLIRQKKSLNNQVYLQSMRRLALLDLLLSTVQLSIGHFKEALSTCRKLKKVITIKSNKHQLIRLLYNFAYCYSHLGDQRKEYQIWRALSKMRNILLCKKKKIKLKQERKSERKWKKSKGNINYFRSFMDFQL